MKIQRGELTFDMTPASDFICEELVKLPQTFAKRHSLLAIREAVAEYLALLRTFAMAWSPQEDLTPDSQRIVIGKERFETAVDKLKSESAELGAWEIFLFWFGRKSLMNGPEAGVSISAGGAAEKIREKVVWQFLVGILPQQVQMALARMELENDVYDRGHFALLFSDERAKIRRIVTDTQLFEIHGAFHHAYLTITSDGRPLARFTCERGGERGFFDGVRLMSHKKFTTCSPRPFAIPGGYMLNSNRCTIVNGMLFDWLLPDPMEVNPATDRVRVEGSKVMFDGTEVRPWGVFAPSKTILLPSGFTHCEWSDFYETDYIQFRKVFVVDRKQEWVDNVVAAFRDEVHIEGCCTTSADEALARILEVRPDAVIIDLHLTDERRFDLLWIAERLRLEKVLPTLLIGCNEIDPFVLKNLRSAIKLESVDTCRILDRIRLALCKKELPFFR